MSQTTKKPYLNTVYCYKVVSVERENIFISSLNIGNFKICKFFSCNASIVNTPMSEAGQSTTSSWPSDSTSTLRPKAYKVKDDLKEYQKLVNQHAAPTVIYDMYMNVTPAAFHNIHAFILGFGKLARLVFLYFLFYHTLWYLPKDRLSTPIKRYCFYLETNFEGNLLATFAACLTKIVTA